MGQSVVSDVLNMDRDWVHDDIMALSLQILDNRRRVVIVQENEPRERCQHFEQDCHAVMYLRDCRLVHLVKREYSHCHERTILGRSANGAEQTMKEVIERFHILRYRPRRRSERTNFKRRYSLP